MFKTWYEYLKNRGYKVFAIIFLILAIMSFSSFYFLSKDDSQIVVLADRRNNKSDKSNFSKRKIELLKVSFNDKKVLKFKQEIIIDFPYNTESNRSDPLTHRKLRNLMKGNGEYEYFFIDVINATTSNSKLAKYQLHFFTPPGKTLLSKKEIVRNPPAAEECYFTGLNSRLGFLLFNIGWVTDISSLNESRKYSKIRRLGKTPHWKGFAGNARFLKDGSIITLNSLSESSVVNEALVHQNLLEFKPVGRLTGKTLRHGYSPNSHLGIIKSEYSSPLALSPDDKVAGFFALLPEEDTKRNYSWFCLWNIEKDSADNIVRINEGFIKNFGPDGILWNPDLDNHIVALFTGKEFLIIDYKQKKIKKSFLSGACLKSMRWSPDGNRLGILDFDGSFYVYDMEKDSVEKIFQDNDYFDFFWIPKK